MQDNDPGGFAQRNVRFFRMLAIVLGFGVVAALILGLGDVPGLGLFDVYALSRALVMALLVVTVVLTMFLLRIGVIFDVERQVKDLFASEQERLTDMRRSEEQATREFRESLRQELGELRDSIKREFNQRDQMYDGAMRASNQALKAAQDALARAEALSREPAYRTTIEQLVSDVGDMKRDLTALRTADKVNSPLLKELQEKVVVLEQGQKKLNVRVDETMESIERRDMEQAALRATLDQELASLKKRETLLLVKQKELESQNVTLAQDARPKPVARMSPQDEKQHIFAIEGIGPAYATRLNAHGVITIPQLIAVDADKVGNAIGATPELVKEWQAMAALLRLKGVGPQYAEVLVRAGITSVKQLAAETPESVSQKIRDVEKGRKSRIQGGEVTPAVALRWIDAAREGKFDHN
jgi:predicted flap endonuclease-1-like 5' DNA nuclease